MKKYAFFAFLFLPICLTQTMASEKLLQNSQNDSFASQTTQNIQDSRDSRDLNQMQDSSDSADSRGLKDSSDSSSLKDSNDFAKDSKHLTQDSSDSNNIIESTTTQTSFSFSPAIVDGNTYGAFAIGYQLLSKSNEKLKHGVFFSLERGWSFINHILLFSFALDGSIGGFYSLNLNARLGVRALDGRLIPNISLGYGLFNHKISGTQHNLHGTNVLTAIFVDIASGFGIEVAYRASLYPFRTIKATSTKTNIHSFLLNFKYIDFRI